MPTKPAATEISTFTHVPYTITLGTRSSTTKNHAGKWLLRNGDTVTCSQHGAQTIVGTASIAVDLDLKKFAREGDVTSCGAVITIGTGDPTILWS